MTKTMKMTNAYQPARVCPLPRWPLLASALADRGWKVHHLTRLLGERPSVIWAWFYGRAEMPHHAQRQTERLLGLAPGGLN
jgi:hypothetical protein